MLGVVLQDGETGHVEFDARGDRVGSLYKIVNVQPRECAGRRACSGGGSRPAMESGNLATVGTFGIPEVSNSIGINNSYL